MKRYFYIIALRNNTNAVAPDSSYRVASGQVRAETMDGAFKAVCREERITRDRDPRFRMRDTYDYFRNGQRVSVYVTPVADDN